MRAYPIGLFAGAAELPAVEEFLVKFKPPPRTGAARFVGLLVIFSILCACSPRTMILKGVADELASQGEAAEEDLTLA